MGALTLKSFPFELRGWDIEKFESFDPTDGFGSNTRVYVSKDQIVLIEPDYNVNTFNTWLTDKGRQFFDGVFGSWDLKKINKSRKKNATSKNFWSSIVKAVVETTYILDHCNHQKFNQKFITIVFENLNLEVLTFLLIISQNFSFVKLRRVENCTVNNNLESDFQLNISCNQVKLNRSTLCLLVSSNPRYEGYYLNLNLRQRFFKGNFKCLLIGSLTDLTFPISFLGSNIKILKTVTEGNSLICQELKSSKNPLVIYNSELLKRNDGNNVIEMLKILNYSMVFNNAWNGLNMIGASLSEIGTIATDNFKSITLNDLNKSSLIYFINVTSSKSTSNLQKITELSLLKYIEPQKFLVKNFLFLDQNYKINNNYHFFSSCTLNSNPSNINTYAHLPVSTFYENEDTFINTEGFMKKTTKLIFQKKNKNNWQILRKLLSYLKKNFVSLDKKNNSVIFFNSKQIINFKNYTTFTYYATQNLTNLNCYLILKTTPIVFHKNVSQFKEQMKKIQNTKVKYWLDDFFTGGKDGYSQNSLILTNCSKILRSETTNFF